MKVFLVGGAVRDQLLGLPVKEKDWVVVGATEAEMLDQGYRQVGKDFPVFLHPETHEEYALARRERKVGKGYTGFTFNTSPEVTLEEDLLRRDLTINAIAAAADGELFDPYHGKVDLEKKILRHVSAAFVEDPVRILRVARFAARFADLGFTVAPETVTLMQAMVRSGEANALVAERVWKEWERALAEPHPEVFFTVLADCQALPLLFPSINLPGPGMNALLQAAKLSSDPCVRFAALMYPLTADELNSLCHRYRIPNEYRELALLMVRHSEAFIHARDLSADQLLALLQSVDAFRRESRFRLFLLVGKALARALSLEESQSVCLLKAYDAARAIDVAAISASQKDGKQIAAAIQKARLDAIKLLLKS